MLFRVIFNIQKYYMKIIRKECMVEEMMLIFRIGGFSPFYCFDSDCKDIVVNTCPSRIRSTSVYILPDVTLLSLFPSSFFAYDSSLDIVLLSPSIQIPVIKALFPFSSNIHSVRCINGPIIEIEDKRIVIARRNQDVVLDLDNSYFRPINVQIGKANQSIAEKMSSKRINDIPINGFKKIACTSKSVLFTGTKIKKDNNWISRLKQVLEQVWDK